MIRVSSTAEIPAVKQRDIAATLFATNDRHKALKLAQNETKKQFPEPRHWAAWVMLD